MSFLSSPVLQQSEEGWGVPEDGEVAGDGGGKDRVSFDQNGTMPFSGVSMCRGGISTVVHHRVSKTMLFLQSWQRSGIAARSYMTPLDPRAESARITTRHEIISKDSYPTGRLVE